MQAAELATSDAEVLSPIADAPVPDADLDAGDEGEKPEASASSAAKPDESEAAKPEEAKPDEDDPKESPFQRRIDRLAAERSAERQRADRAEQAANDLRARLAALNPDEAPKPEQPDPVEIAKAQIRQEEAVRTFNAECNVTHAAGVKEFPDFEQSLVALGPNGLDVMTIELINAALEAGDAHKVLYALGKNPAEAERIAALPAARMGAAVAKFATKTIPTLAAAKPVSSAPAPLKPISGSASHVETDPSKMSMEEFEKRFPLPSRH